jgi:ribosomal-protein-alanine N-acetyltransferase
MLVEADTLPTLTGRRVRLRWLTAEDIPDLFQVFSHPDVAEYWSSPAMQDPAEAESLLQSIREHFQNQTLLQWGIERQDQQGIVGTCTLAALDSRNRRADLGYALHRDLWGQGLIADTLTTVLGFAFDNLKLHRIEADVDPRNERSIRVLERQGFQREGFLRERWIVDGVVADTALYGLLAREWPGRDGTSLSVPRTAAEDC